MLSTYAIVQGMLKVIEKYHPCTKGTNSVVIFCEWIKSMLNIEKVL